MTSKDGGKEVISGLIKSLKVPPRTQPENIKNDALDALVDAMATILTTILTTNLDAQH